MITEHLLVVVDSLELEEDDDDDDVDILGILTIFLTAWLAGWLGYLDCWSVECVMSLILARPPLEDNMRNTRM